MFFRHESAFGVDLDGTTIMFGNSWMKKGPFLYVLAIVLALVPILIIFGYPQLAATMSHQLYCLIIISPFVLAFVIVFVAYRINSAPPQERLRPTRPVQPRPPEQFERPRPVQVDEPIKIEEPSVDAEVSEEPPIAVVVPETQEAPVEVVPEPVVEVVKVVDFDNLLSTPTAPTEGIQTDVLTADETADIEQDRDFSVSQESMNDSELLQLCNGSLHIYCVADFDGKIIEANEAAKRLYTTSGLDRGAKSWYDAVHPEDQYRTAMAVSKLLAGDSRIGSFRNRIRGENGYKWMDWSAISKYDTKRLYIVGQDVTEFQSAFLALSDSELRFRVAFNAMHEGMLVVNSEGLLTLVNRSAQRILGVDESEALGRRIFPSSVPLLREDRTILTPDDHPLAKALLTGEPQPDIVFGFHTEEGELRWIQANAVPLFHQGELVPYAAVSTLSDVTESRAVNEQIQSYLVTLESQKEQLEQANARLEEANIQLQTLATTDALTGLRNHRAFQQRMAEEIMRAERYKTPLSLILLDVDQFKSYNDSFGHPAGDEVLRRLSEILREHARQYDLVARYGGEEFILLTPHTDMAGAEVVAERCRQAIEKVHWTLRPVTASFGIAMLGYGIETGAELIACADHALYAAKAAGRNRVSLYVPSLGKPAQN